MLVRLLLLCFMLIMSALPAHASDGEDACDASRTVPVHVRSLFEDPTYDFTHNIASINAMSADAHHTIREAITLGLTHYEPIIEMRVPIASVQLPDGLGCARVENVDVTIGYRNITIFIASEVPNGSCGYREIMLHEDKHVDANMQTLQEFVPQIEAELTEFVRENSVFRQANAEYATDLLHTKIQEIIERAIHEMTTENQARQLKIDSEEEYKRISQSCGGQLQSFITPALRARH